MQEFEKSSLRVWYGFDKFNKLRKHRALRIRFENSSSNYGRKMTHVKRMGSTVMRFQTVKEATDGAPATREFTDYVLFIDKKPFFGDIEAVLEENFKQDSNNVSEAEREEIRSKLRVIFKTAYPNIREKQQL